MKKILLVSLVLTSVMLVGCGKKSNIVSTPAARPTQAPTPTPAETQLPESERPVVTMKPDVKMQTVNLKITNLPDDVKDVDYELVYLSSQVEKGQIGTYYVSKAKNDITLGTCSSGKCVYDQGITTGTLTITYETNGQEVLLRYPFTPGN